MSDDGGEVVSSPVLESLGEQATALDERISSRILEQDREQIWKSVSNILDSYEKGHNTTLAWDMFSRVRQRVLQLCVQQRQIKASM
jgi:hypothetical protein